MPSLGFKAILDCQGPVPTAGWVATARFVLGAVLTDQVALLYRFETQAPLRLVSAQE